MDARAEADDLPAPPRMRAGRGVRLVATWGRWSAGMGALLVVLLVAIECYRQWAHPGRPLGSFAELVAVVCTAGGLLIAAILHAEESRLNRELRTARSGTSVLRDLTVRRRTELPFFARLFSTRLGAAAILLADGDRAGATEALAAEPFLMRGGRLDGLRAIVDADIERAASTSLGLDRCVLRLRAAAPLGHREADLYRTHVLVKAVLEQGDAETGLEMAEDLIVSLYDDERVYATWLRVWFDLDEGRDATEAATDPWPELSEGDLRVASLAARAHGAERLVELFDARLAAIARPGGEG